jgi:4-amino-4-deoxy-L-arabinose transferase-like glycosyltransferase
MKIKSIINHWPLITILVLAAILRFWHLGSNPPGLTPDEASLGYNAYSILKTGKDEYGKWFPVIFKSFGDYKPGLYVYLTVPSVAVLGLNEFAVRLPSALAGVFSVFLIYLIVNRLFPNELIGNWKLEIGTLAAFIAALNPWSIYFSRGAWEVNVALTLTLAGIYFFLKSFEKQRYLITSSLFFALTLVTYQGAKLSTGIVVLLLVAIYWKGIFKYKLSILLTSLGVGFIISLPIIISLFNGSTGRLTVFSVFSYPRPIEYIQNQLNEGG